jgi:2-polyprenyl-6-hydroxyphenyl methylase/3-demethylubiquinone-9 3-methyltransferase
LSTASAEINRAERFAFGDNWRQFLSTLNEDRIEQSCKKLQDLLEVEDLNGVRFLDVGSGSGLSSLAARRLGAYVHSFDFDPQSVACTQELKRQYFADDENWTIEQGSVLDTDFLSDLGQWDLVYSWGVLHHTGAMWDALENVAPLVKDGGHLFVAIYNDQGPISRRWSWMKQTYNRFRWSRPLLLAFGMLRFWGPTTVKDVFRGQPFNTWRNYTLDRGMSPWFDVVDWVGGWPFEVATPEAIFRFYRDRGFKLQNLFSRQGIGCNEFVLYKEESKPGAHTPNS